jgi:hypothetical protein
MGVQLVCYKQLQNGDRSVLPAISRTKTLSLEYGYCTVALSKVGSHGKPCRWLWNTSVIVRLRLKK